MSRSLLTLLSVLLLTPGCDTGADIELVQAQHRTGSNEPVRTNPDPCANAPEQPGITLTSDEVAIADLCIAQLPEVESCSIALGETEGTVEIWCDFVCGETVDTLAAYPDAGQVRVELHSPC